MTSTCKLKFFDLRVLFAAMLMSTISIPFISFYLWNGKALPIKSNFVFDLTTYHVDSCKFKGRGIKVEGWAFTKDEPSAVNRVFAIMKDGKYSEIMTTVQRRPDVSKFFNEKEKYDRSGFVASKFFINKSQFSEEIIVTSEDYKGVLHASKHTCKEMD